MEKFRANYWRVWCTFLRNSLVREMTFRGNFLVTMATRAFWFAAQLVFFEIIFGQVRTIRDWSREEYLGFMATGMLINALVETFFMPNCANLSELIRTGNLDFALLKPIDTQFLVSTERVNVGMLGQGVFALGLLGYAIVKTGVGLTLGRVLMYATFVGAGVAFFYSLMIVLASLSVFLGRNQGLYDFWFYVTVFARYPQNIYHGQGAASSFAGDLIWFGFSFVIPILLVVTIPSRVVLAKTLEPNWGVGIFLLVATALAVWVGRLVFEWSLRNYRSASS